MAHLVPLTFLAFEKENIFSPPRGIDNEFQVTLKSTYSIGKRYP